MFSVTGSFSLYGWFKCSSEWWPMGRNCFCVWLFWYTKRCDFYLISLVFWWYFVQLIPSTETTCTETLTTETNMQHVTTSIKLKFNGKPAFIFGGLVKILTNCHEWSAWQVSCLQKYHSVSWCLTMMIHMDHHLFIRPSSQCTHTLFVNWWACPYYVSFN